MYRKGIFWILFVLVVISAGYFCISNFDKFMSFVNLEISMDREEALRKAESDAELWGLGPLSPRTAVVFNQDSFLQYYIELSAGGKEAYNEFLEEGKFQPYQWVVRHFVPDQEHQVYLYYTPSGEFYGFEETIPESEPGINLSVEAARQKGEKAAENMGVLLKEFNLIETQKNETVSGRMDYTFVYERPEKIKDTSYRYTIKVSGSKVSQLEYTMKIPESFSREFMEMRSANNTIASFSQYAMIFLYGLLGIGLGSFMLLRKRYLLYKKALIAALIVSGLGFLASFNNLPLSWIWYDTAVSPNTHIMQNILMSLLQFLQDFVILALSFTAAESLTRLAFPDQIQFWQTFAKGSSGSRQLLGNTLGAYGLVAVNLAYVMGFYGITSSNFGWWNPAGLQVDPNFIAMPLPWLSVISQALHAGFWEEALFRAIPLAGMILIGRRYKKEKLFLVLGLVIQALIFSAGHANYAAQPSYARVVELIVPSLLFAFLYLRFGLYTGIVLHFTFDAVLMAMYIWIMKAPGIWLNRILVLAGILLPLFIILYHRLKAGKWQQVKENLLNKNWQPLTPKVVIKKATETVNRQLNPNLKWLLVIMAIAGVGFWITFTDFDADQPQMKLSRAQAIEVSQKLLAEKGIDLDSSWRIDASIQNRTGNTDKLVWQTGGKKIYDSALGNYLKEPAWWISFRTFAGEVADRAEKYTCTINSNAEVVSFYHTYPEAKQGLVLSEAEAKKLAENAITDFYQLDSFYLAEVQASPSQKPQRKDWTFVYKDTINYPLSVGEYRWQVNIQGDQVMGISRYTYVPEDWLRSERSRTRSVRMFSSFSGILYLLIYVVLAIVAVINWSNHKFSFKNFYFVLLVVMAGSLLLKINHWQQVPAGFSTSEPWQNQLLQYLLGSVTNVLLLSFVFGVMAGFLGAWENKSLCRLKFYQAALAGLILAGSAAIAGILKPQHLPLRPELSFLADYSPFLQVVLGAVSGWISSSLLFIFLIKWLGKITAAGTKKRFLSLLILLAFMLVMRQGEVIYMTAGDFMYLAVLCALMAIVLEYLIREILLFDFTILPVFISVYASMPLIKNAVINSWDGALLANLAAVLTLNILACFWVKILRN